MKDQPKITLYFFDRLLLAYGALMVLLLAVFGRPFTAYVDEVLFYVSVIGIVLLVGRYMDERKGRFLHFLRYLYPVLLFTFLYRETGGTMFLFFDRFLDPQLTSFELAVLGVHPTLYIDRHLLNVVVTELLSAAYFLYYPMIPVFMAGVYIRGDYEIVKSSLAAVSLTFFASYLLFALYPIEGPRWYFADRYLHPVEGPFFREMVDLVIRHGAVRGGCMPSSHFGVALVLTLYAARYYRRWLWLTVPVTFGLALGTVWGRFHYVSDVVVGGLIGLAATLLVWKIAPVRHRGGPIVLETAELEARHAS